MLASVSWAASSTITTNGSACPGSTNTTALVVSLPQDKGGATLTISGTWTGTISFKATGDGGTTWTAVNVLPLGSTTAVTSSTSNGTWQVNTAGFTGLCMLSSASMTGSAVATITPSAASFAQRVTGGSGGIGNANYTGTVNVVPKGDSTAHTLVDGSMTDDGTNPVQSALGFNSMGAGFNDQPGANANPGTTLNKMACINSSQQMFTCGTGNTTGTAGVAIAGAGNTGTPTICFTQCNVLYDNQTTIGHVAIVSTTAAGELHDTGSTAQTAGVDNFLIDSVNSGAGTAALTDILTPRNVQAANTTVGGKTSIQVNGSATQPKVNLNGTTPAVQAGYVNATWQASDSGNTTSVSVEVPIVNAVPTVLDTSTPVTVSATLNAEFHFNENATAGTAVTYNLPTAAAGKQFCFSNAYNGSAANTGALTIATSAAGQYIIYTDGTLSATGGNVTSGGAAGDAACVAGADGTHWVLYVNRGTWTKN